MNDKRSYTEYTVTTATTDFVIGFDDYDDGTKDTIVVTVNGVLAESQGYAVMRKNAQVVTITPAVQSGTVRLTRVTDIDESFHQFTAGALFSAKSVDENFQQVRHSQQEVRDGFVFLEYNTNGIVQASKEATAQAKVATVEATASAVRAETAADTAVQAVGSLQGVVDAASTATTKANNATATATTATSQATTATTTAQNAAQAAITAKQEATAATATAKAATVDTLAATGRANAAAELVEGTDVGQLIGAVSELEGDVSTLKAAVATQAVDTGITTTPQVLGQTATTLAVLNKYRLPVQSFGVTGVGTDDTAGLRAYHSYCNTYNIPASYAGLEAVKIQADAQIIVNTSFDLCGAKIHLLNGLAETPTWNNQKVTYIVYDNETPEVSVTGAIDVLGRTAQSLYPTLGLFSGKGYALLTDPDVGIPNRAATDTVSYTQAFHVIRDGQSTQPLSRSIVGTNCTVLYRKDSPRGSLVVKNINLVADGNWNHQTLFNVQRNSVALVDFTLEHISDPATTNISSLVKVVHCSKFVFSGASCKGIEYTSSGTYVLNINGCVDLLLDRIYTATGWGWIGTNNINGMYVQNSSVLRIDGHNSLHNVFVSKTSFHDTGVSCGWGGGVIMMSGITLHGASAFYGRNDYGSYFLGDIIIDGVRVMESATNRAIVNMSSTGAVGVTTKFADNISISNVTLAETPDATKRTYRLITLKVANNGGLVIAPKSVSISNVTTSSNNIAEVYLDYGGSRNYGSHGLNINNVRSRELRIDIASTNTINHTANPVNLSAVLTNISNFIGCNITSPHPISTLVISNVRRLTTLAVPANVTHGISSAINIYDSYIAPASPSVIGNTSAGSSHYTRVYSSEVTNNGNLAGTDALQGCIVGTATGLPATVTPLKAFTGWKMGLTT